MTFKNEHKKKVNELHTIEYSIYDTQTQETKCN
jgi:hypothetical protein